MLLSVCCVLFLIILISPELTAQLTCINEDLLNKTVVEVYLILSTVRLSSKPPDLSLVFLVGSSPVTVVV